MLYNYIIENIAGNHPAKSEIPSLTTYLRELGMYTALYIPFNLITDKQVLDHILTQPRLRPPYFRNSIGLITKEPEHAEDVYLQNRQHRELLRHINPEQTFVIDKGVLVETKPNEALDLIGKNGLIAKNHLTRTITYSAHGVAVPDIYLEHPTLDTNNVIGIPHWMFKKLKLNSEEPIMWLRNPVIKADGVHFCYPVPTIDSNAISVHPYFCDGTNLDFDGDKIHLYKIIHPENIKQAIELMNKRYPNPLPLPTNKDFKLIEHNIHGLSLQDYVNNSEHFQNFVKAKPSRKVNHDLHLSAVDLCKSRTPQEFRQHLTKSTAYKGLFQAKADIGKTGGLYKKLIYAFPEHITEIMEIVEPLSQATLDQKHTAISDFSVDRIVNAFNNLEDTSNLEYVLSHTKPEHHKFITYLHKQLAILPMAVRHKINMPALTYLGTKFTRSFPNKVNSRVRDNLFNFITSLGNPTNEYLPILRPELPEITMEEATKMYSEYVISKENKGEMIPQKYLDTETQLIYEHRFNKTLVDKTNKFSEYLTSQMVSVPFEDGNLYLLPPRGFCPYQRTEKDPENPKPITFIPNFGNYPTSATPLNIPYLHNTEHARLVYACNNIKQAMQLENAEEPLCRTKHHKTLKIGVNLIATFLSHPDVYEDAVVISETASIKLMTIDGNKAKPGDKLTGRHGNKCVISRVVPDEEMPEGAEIIFSPMTITTRQNFGFLAEIQSNIFNNNKPHIETPIETLLEQPDPKVNGTLTGMVYILRNNHIAENGSKVVSLPKSYTQFKQPAQGETISLNHLYALEVLGMRGLIAEFFSFRSNQTQIENKTMLMNIEPESIKVLRTVYTLLV